MHDASTDYLKRIELHWRDVLAANPQSDIAHGALADIIALCAACRLLARRIQQPTDPGDYVHAARAQHN